MNRIYKHKWSQLGGVSNPKLWRKQVRGSWRYYRG